MIVYKILMEGSSCQEEKVRERQIWAKKAPSKQNDVPKGR